MQFRRADFAEAIIALVEGAVSEEAFAALLRPSVRQLSG